MSKPGGKAAAAGAPGRAALGVGSGGLFQPAHLGDGVVGADATEAVVGAVSVFREGFTLAGESASTP